MSPHFLRTVPPPDVSGGYAAFRPYVRIDFRQCCAYCCLHEFWAGGARNFEMDHFRPVSRFASLTNDFYNLRYSCHVCNQTKSDYWVTPQMGFRHVGIVDLTVDDFASHYFVQANGLLQPATQSAEYTIALLRLNSDHLQQLRAFILRNGWTLEGRASASKLLCIPSHIPAMNGRSGMKSPLKGTQSGRTKRICDFAPSGCERRPIHGPFHFRQAIHGLLSGCDGARFEAIICPLLPSATFREATGKHLDAPALRWRVRPSKTLQISKKYFGSAC